MISSISAQVTWCLLNLPVGTLGQKRQDPKHPTQSHEANQRHLYLQFLVPPRKCQNVSDGAIDGIILRIFRLIGSSSGGVMSGSTFSIFHSERL